MPFVHLHTHSHYSFLMGIPSPKVLVSKAKELLFEALALTDSSNVCGVVEAVEAAEKEGVKLIIGAEIWTIDGPENEKEPAPGAQLVLLVKSDAGWRNLCQILTIAHRQRSFSPRIRLEQLKEHREGLHVLTGGQWGIFQEEKRCEERLMALVDAVGPGSIDVEVVDHGKEGDATRNERAASFAERLSLPVVATNDSRYLQTTDIGILEGLVKVGVGENPALVDMVCGTDQATLKTEAEMRELWPEKWIERSGQIAEMCSFKLPRGKPMLPRVEDHETLESITNRFPPPRGFPEAPRQIEGDKRPVDKYFRWLCTEGLKMRLREEPEAIRFATEEEYFKQLEFECGVIEGMEYVVYHLIVSEFTNWAKDNKIAVGPGRGSAAGSVAVWALRITDVNPRQFGLFFERFLNPERRGLPDIDMDFEQERREEVIAHVREKYGEECVGQILTIGKMKAKGALKDAARVCRAHFDESNYWSMFIDNGPKAKLKDSLGQGYLRALKEGSPLFHRVSDLALAFEGKPRQQGVHAAGVIIASDPVSRFCPMHYMPADQISCTGLDMDAAEKVGLVKFDFLGLKTLDVIRIASAMVREKTGSEPKIVDPLFDDPAVFELMRSGETEGLFQIESGGMNRLIRRLVPNNFEEVICLLALYRPGPLKAGMVNSWIERKHGREVVESVHPLLDEVLGPTYGLIVYQEQALSTARVLAGFSLGQADLLRRAIGKKKADEMAQQRSSFVKGCWETNRIDEKEATRVFNLIDYFSGYSFNKAHSAAYAIITYMTAKLKAHHQTEFMAASMTLDMGDKDRIRQYAGALRRTGIKLLRPDINRSLVGFSAEEDSVRFGLGAIRGLGNAVIPGLISNRPYSSVEDLIERAKVSMPVAEALVWSGAMDSVEKDRFNTWWKLKRPRRKALPKKIAAEQVLLFGGGKTVGEVKDEEDLAAEDQVKPSRLTEIEIFGKEANFLGVSLGVHPLERFDDVRKKVQTHSILGLRAVGPERTPFIVVARIDDIEKEEDRRGDSVAFVTLEDTEASIRVVLRGQVLKKIDQETTLAVGNCIAVHGTASAFEDNDPIVVVEQIDLMSEFRWRTGRSVEIEIRSTDLTLLDQIRKILDSNTEKATHEVFVKIIGGDKTSWAKLDRKVQPSQVMLDALERLTGRPDVVHVPTAEK